MFWQRTDPGPSTPSDEWFTPRRFALILAALTFATYPDVIIGLKTFYHRDFAVFGYPLAYHHRESFWRGEIPLWNPLNDCGLPFLAQWNTMTLYPLSLFYLLLPLSWSLGMFCLIHFFIAGMGMYFLAHWWTGSRFAAAVAGLAFCFNALMLNCLMWPNNIAALAWLPWLILLAERGWREGGRWLLLAVLTGTMQMLSGAPEVILLTWMFLAVVVAGQMWLNPSNRIRVCLRFLLIVLWIAALAAVQLIPFLDLLTHSQRSKEFADLIWSMPVWGWANYLVPLFRNYLTAEGGYAQPQQFWVPSYYMGVGVIALAALTIAQVRNPRILLMIGLTALCLLMALGKQGLLYPIIRRVVPGIGFMRYPIKFVLLPTFLIPLLAAFSVRYLLSSGQTERLRQSRVLLSLGISGLVLIGFICWVSFQFPFAATSSVTAARSAVSRAAFLIAILAGIAAITRVDHPLRLPIARIAVMLIFWLDIITAGPRPNPTVPLWVYEPNLVRKELKLEPAPTIGQSRTLLSSDAENRLMYVPLTNGIERVLHTRLSLYANANLLDDVPKVVGMYSLFFRELGEVLGCLWISTNPPVGLTDFLSVSHINSPGKAMHWDFRPSYMQWVSAGQKPIFANASETLSRLASEEFNPRKIVFLPLNSRNQIAATNSGSAKVDVQRFARHKAEFEIETAEPTMAVISQSFYHNWKAYLDGRPTPLFRGNHAFQTVEVPKGKHNVAIVYEDHAFYYGAAISGVAGICFVVGWLRQRRNHNRRAAQV